MPCEVHHLLRNGKRIDDLHTIGLCPSHHRQGLNHPHFVSRHPWRREFEKRYGSEMEMLEITKKLIAKEAQHE